MSMRSLLLCMGLALTPMAAMAQSAQDAIISQLTQQGFGNIVVQNTLLGRVRILATSSDLNREIVFNPATGEILRDFWEPRNDRATAPRPTLSNPGTFGSDDDDDDGGTRPGSGSGTDDDDDDGGSTGSGSGTGSGGSSGGSDDDDDDSSSGGSSGGSDDDDDDRDDDRDDDSDDDSDDRDDDDNDSDD